MIKKMFRFRNIQICVEGDLNVYCYIVHVSNPTCYEFKIHFPLILPSSYFFLLFLSLFLFLLVIIFLFVLSCHGLCFWNCHIRGVVYIS